MIVYAHRGASVELPENSLEAFRLALELGADAIETDVHVTRDGRPVLHHDPDGLRTASVPALIAASSLEEIERWNLGFGFRLPNGDGLENGTFRVPSLDAALEAIDAPFNVDIKARGAGAVEAVLGVVARHRAEDRVLLTSFSDAVLAEVRGRGYRGATGLGRNECLRALALPPSSPRWLRPKGTRAQIPVEMYGLPLDTPGVVRRLKSNGLAVDFWVVNDASQARRIVEIGADGVMTDDPRTVVPACRPRAS